MILGKKLHLNSRSKLVYFVVRPSPQFFPLFYINLLIWGFFLNKEARLKKLKESRLELQTTDLLFMVIPKVHAYYMTEIHFKFKAGSISTEVQTFLCESIKRVGTRATKRHAIS